MARLSRGSAPGGGMFRTVERTGLRKGMNGSKGWFYLGTGLWTLRTVRRLAERKEEILISEQLKPGQRIIISNGRATIDETGEPESKPLSGRKARQARRQAER